MARVSSVAVLALLTAGYCNGALLRANSPGEPDGPAPPPQASQKPTKNVPSVVRTLNDPCFYDHLGSCSPCVLAEGCGFCADGHPAVKGKCISGDQKGPFLHRGCSKWLFKVCKIPKETPPYVPAVVEKPKPAPAVVPPRVAVPVKVTQSNKTKLSPWNVKPEVVKPTGGSRKEKKSKANPAEPRKKAPKVPGFDMKKYINNIVEEEKDTRKGLEVEQVDALRPASKPEEERENEGADEGVEEVKEQIRGEEVRTVRERKRVLEEAWKRDIQKKTAHSIGVQEHAEIKSERAILEETSGVVGALPAEAGVVGKGAWPTKTKGEKEAALSDLHNTRGFIKSANYLKIFSHPNRLQSTVHLGTPTTSPDYTKISDTTANKLEGMIASPMNPTTFRNFRTPSVKGEKLVKVTLKDKNMTVYKSGGIDSEALAAEEEFLPSDDTTQQTNKTKKKK